MTEQTSPTPNFGKRLGLAFLTLLRVVLILAVIAGIAAAIYYGTPYLYEKFILPVETNTARLAEVESKQTTDMAQLQGQMADLKARLTTLETRQTDSSQAMAELQGQITALETAVATHTETLKQLEAIQTSLDELAAITTTHETILVGENSGLADLQRQVTLSRAIELLSRARLYLSQSNFGLAEEDIQTARSLLAGLQSRIPRANSAALQAVLDRLDLALGNLPGFPVVAVDDVDIAWQLLIYGLPDQPPVTPTVEAILPTPEATPTPTVTP